MLSDSLLRVVRKPGLITYTDLRVDVRRITVQYDVSFVPPEEDTCALPADIGVPAQVPVAEDTPLWLFVSVKDTGPGLKPNELAILFKRFSRTSRPVWKGHTALILRG
jgi:signal transduction histidine kinase